jgi:TetR/AcrR family transcriptional repressor of nem operon
MRYHKEHKENTRRRVVHFAAARFRKDGFGGVGVATLMGDAGLTHGGFYSYFTSKEALIKEAVETGMDDKLKQTIKASRNGGIEAFVREYLRPAHREHPERGCPAAAIGSEIRRHSRATRAAFTRLQLSAVAHISSLLPKPDEGTAQAIFSLLVGTLQLARNAPDAKLSDQILKSGERAAIKLARSSEHHILNL